MIISRTPLRISFFGGGTDLPSFYKREYGCVISTSINKYVHLIGHKSFEGNYKIHYNITEIVDSINQIKNTRVKEAFKELKLDKGFELYSIGEVPHGTGLGSSSSFTVGLINLICHFNREKKSKRFFAEKACEIEIKNLKEPIGKQDQYAAAFGGFNFIKFNEDDSVEISPLNISEKNKEIIQNNLVLFYLNKVRNASDILKEQSSEIESKVEKFESLKKLKEITLKMKEDLENNNLENFGKKLGESWKIKRELTNSISDKFIDEIYDKGLSAGASGGKVLGAGGGGFILFYCEKKFQEKLRESLSHLKEFKIEFEKEGSKIIYEI